MKKLNLNDKINCEEYQDCLIRDIVYENGVIFSLIKKYKYDFSDEVLREAHIIKTCRDFDVKHT